MMYGKSVTDADRLAVRNSPSGQPIMHQNWGKLLFIHWPIEADVLRPFVPQGLNLDLFEGMAWLGLIPFTMWDIRGLPPFAPPIPGLNSMHEFNVRTYVHYDGVPGVWFFSLDINSEVAAAAARTFFHLPYHAAEIELLVDKGEYDFRVRRKSNPSAVFEARWSVGQLLPEAQPGSREFFLTERYCLYAKRGDKLYRSRVHHQPWPLREATLKDLDSQMCEAAGLPAMKGKPLVHYADEVNVDIWFLERLTR